MRESLLWFGLIFFVSLSGVLFFKQRQSPPAQPAIAPPSPSSETWLSALPLERLTDASNQPVALQLPQKAALIVADMSQGCNACLFAEAEDWQKFLNSQTGIDPRAVALVCRSFAPKQTKREFNALGIKYAVVFDSAGAFQNALQVKRPPEVFFTYQGKTICRYEADVSNRALTKTMQEKFREFLNLK